jgi:hypothetical protein
MQMKLGTQHVVCCLEEVYGVVGSGSCVGGGQGDGDDEAKSELMLSFMVCLR